MENSASKAFPDKKSLQLKDGSLAIKIKMVVNLNLLDIGSGSANPKPSSSESREISHCRAS